MMGRDEMAIAIGFNAEEIAEIIIDCEKAQESQESRYTKEQMILKAYKDMLELIGGEENV